MSKGHASEKGSLANTIKWKHINIHHHVNTEEYIIQVSLQSQSGSHANEMTKLKINLRLSRDYILCSFH